MQGHKHVPGVHMVRNDEVESGGTKGKGKEILHAAPFYLNALKSLVPPPK